MRHGLDLFDRHTVLFAFRTLQFQTGPPRYEG